MFKNKNLLIIILVMFVNSLGYAIIIPLLYDYSARFGLSDFQNGLLFSLFSLCQFFATPVIGRFSDLYGRKPLLIISLLGTFVSFIMMAFAPSAIFLFLARALDGLTAGNFPVAVAVISDSTKPEERAQSFGKFGAAWSLGFFIGPAISGLTVGISPIAPFLIAAAITLLSVALAFVFLPETNKHKGVVHDGKLFDFPKLARAVRDQNVGNTLLITLIFSLAFGLLIFAYNPFLLKVLHLSASQGALTFSLFGVVGFIAQMFLIPPTVKRIRDKKLLLNALAVVSIAFFAIFIAKSLAVFLVGAILLASSNAFINPLLQSLLSKETDEKSQGEIQGINTSYSSIGFIFGPIIGGLLAENFSIPSAFLAGSLLSVVCVFVAYKIFSKPEKPISL